MRIKENKLSAIKTVFRSAGFGFYKTKKEIFQAPCHLPAAARVSLIFVQRRRFCGGQRGHPGGIKPRKYSDKMRWRLIYFGLWLSKSFAAVLQISAKSFSQKWWVVFRAPVPPACRQSPAFSGPYLSQFVLMLFASVRDGRFGEMLYICSYTAKKLFNLNWSDRAKPNKENGCWCG